MWLIEPEPERDQHHHFCFGTLTWVGCCVTRFPNNVVIYCLQAPAFWEFAKPPVNRGVDRNNSIWVGGNNNATTDASRCVENWDENQENIRFVEIKEWHWYVFSSAAICGLDSPLVIKWVALFPRCDIIFWIYVPLKIRLILGRWPQLQFKFESTWRSPRGFWIFPISPYLWVIT